LARPDAGAVSATVPLICREARQRQPERPGSAVAGEPGAARPPSKVGGPAHAPAGTVLPHGRHHPDQMGSRPRCV